MSKGSRKRPVDPEKWDAFWAEFDKKNGGLRGQATKEGPWCDECNDTGKLPDGSFCKGCKRGLQLQFGAP